MLIENMSGPFHFLDLPLEIRHMILGLLIFPFFDKDQKIATTKIARPFFFLGVSSKNGLPKTTAININ